VVGGSRQIVTAVDVLHVRRRAIGQMALGPGRPERHEEDVIASVAAVVCGQQGVQVCARELPARVAGHGFEELPRGHEKATPGNPWPGTASTNESPCTTYW
jgi:hypothetical protein